MERMKLGRRGFMAALGFGAAAGPAAAKMVAPKLMTGGNIAGGLSMATSYAGKSINFPAPSPPWTARGISEMAWKALHQKAEELDERRRNRWNNRIDGLDADLWAMRSMAMPAKLAIQARRDRELERQISEASEGLFGKPERAW